MNWLRKMMIGRYGVDDLSKVMVTLSIILVFISMFTRLEILNSIGMLILIVSYFRIFSKNINKRYQENMKFLKWWNPKKSKWNRSISNIKGNQTHRYYNCPQCNQELRVPKGKGKITITCPSCKNKFIKKT